MNAFSNSCAVCFQITARYFLTHYGTAASGQIEKAIPHMMTPIHPSKIFQTTGFSNIGRINDPARLKEKNHTMEAEQAPITNNTFFSPENCPLILPISIRLPI